MSLATAARQDWAADYKGAIAKDLAATLDAIRKGQPPGESGK
jgi:hypothetical protein